MPPLLPVHIAAGGLAIVVGAIALFAAKGANLHRKSGMVFVAAMLTMGLSGSALALKDGWNANAMGGFMSAYLVTTAWTTVRRPDTGARQLEVGGMVLIFALGLLNLVLGIVAVTSPRGMLSGVPFPAFFIFSTVALFAGVGDLRVVRSGVLKGAPRLRRHLWRMCFALFIATGSFFSIRSRVARILPAPFLGGGTRLIPILLPLLLMIFWLWRVRAGRATTRAGPLVPATAREAV
jgi:uncharacterized membrane protein